MANVLCCEDRLAAGLRDLMAAHACVKEVRGTGYLYAVELTRDRDTGTDLTEAEFSSLLPGGVLERFVRDARVLVRPDSRGAAMLMLSPPLVADAGASSDLLHRVDPLVHAIYLGSEAGLRGADP